MADSEAMCTVVVSLQPTALVPLLLLGVRDEFTGRPWQPPARHWPGSPLIGGLDEQASGTWLAVHPEQSRVGCILNGRGEFAPPDRRRSRGELPLRAAAEGQQALKELYQAPETLARYDPFYLVCADLGAVLLLGWAGDGLAATEPGAIIVRRELPDGRIYGSTSVTLVALAADGSLRYDFQPDPHNTASWYPVETG
jgi:hypothetical protein